MVSMTIIPQDIIRDILCRLPTETLARFRNLHKDYTLLVLNLTTKDYVELPISSKKQFYGMKGFGYNSVSDNYKVVTKPCVNEYSRNVYVYNLRTNTGKQVSHSPYDLNDKSWLAGVFVNGFLHWIFSRQSKPIIVAFSLADESFSELASPNLYNETKLVALGEKLAIFNEVKGDIWLMNEYGVQKSWTKIVVHAFKEIPMVRPKVFYDNGKVLLLTPDLLRIYDVEEQTFCKSYDISYMNICYFISAYAESLVSPKFS
ncbi:F-box associated interaction domain-containing protein [Artemisia annua]|uniref:F-box associated interaction domain-containing protein n=1 Tax=Artemisia annua TaxID=35608 RepID=A0A2U1L3J6_ARTAN|nr:F-box associated interaction domain-containing protein [Artemisia annua]